MLRASQIKRDGEIKTTCQVVSVSCRSGIHMLNPSPVVSCPNEHPSCFSEESNQNLKIWLSEVNSPNSDIKNIFKSYCPSVVSSGTSDNRLAIALSRLVSRIAPFSVTLEEEEVFPFPKEPSISTQKCTMTRNGGSMKVSKLTGSHLPGRTFFRISDVEFLSFKDYDNDWCEDFFRKIHRPSLQHIVFLNDFSAPTVQDYLMSEYLCKVTIDPITVAFEKVNESWTVTTCLCNQQPCIASNLYTILQAPLERLNKRFEEFVDLFSGVSDSRASGCHALNDDGIIPRSVRKALCPS